MKYYGTLRIAKYKDDNLVHIETKEVRNITAYNSMIWSAINSLNMIFGKPLKENHKFIIYKQGNYKIVLEKSEKAVI